MKLPGEKTEQATPKKRQDERKKGNIFLSKDVITVTSLIGTFFTLKILLPQIIADIREYILLYFNYASTKSEISASFISDMMIGFIIIFAKVAMPLLLITILISIVATVAQTKMLFAADSLKPKFNRLNPLEGFKKMVSAKSLVEILKGLIKISILLYIMYGFIQGRIIMFAKTINMEVYTSSAFLLESIMQLVFNITIAFVAVSALDFIYQKWDYEKQIRMSKQEIKEEYKQMEGDPLIKSKIKDMQRKIAMSRMMQAVPNADVVVRNPTHFAVALRYDIKKDSAPILVAKGQDEMALRIVKIAEENNVYVLENKLLARAIFATTELNREVPAEFYGTIAEILVYIYKLNNKKFE